MSAQIHVNDGTVFIVKEPFDEIESGYQRALASGGIFRIINSQTGKVHVINAAQVIRIENLTEVQQVTAE
jgi:hypothetical protein